MGVRDIETAITQLSAHEVAKLADWFDLDAGRLDRLLEEVENEYAAGLSRPL